VLRELRLLIVTSSIMACTLHSLGLGGTTERSEACCRVCRLDDPMDQQHWQPYITKRYMTSHNMLFAGPIRFLPDRDYVTFGSLLSQIHLLSVVSRGLTLMHPLHPTQGLKLSAIFLHRCVPWPYYLRAHFTGIVPGEPFLRGR